MNTYANPPQEGIHYIRLKSFDPVEAKAQLATITQEVWDQLSIAGHEWWKVNASVEGLWKLTQRLVEEKKD
jgi:hypothetical protein